MPALGGLTRVEAFAKADAWRRRALRGLGPTARARLRALWSESGGPGQHYLWLFLAFFLPLLGLPFVPRGGHVAHWQRLPQLAVPGAVRQIVGESTAEGAVLYAVVERWGIYRSEDGGLAWEPVNRRLPQGSLGQVAMGLLALAPDSAQFLLLAPSVQAGSGRPALYKTVDGGRFWNPRRGLGAQDVDALLIAPGKRVYAVSGQQLYQSLDAGDTWLEGSNRPTSSLVLAMVFDSERGILYTGTASDGLWLSADQGESWSATLPGQAIHALALGEGGRVYAGTEAGLYASADRGQSWQLLTSLTVSGTVGALVASPDAPERIIVALDTVRGERVIEYSNDSGATWHKLPTALLGARVTALAGDPQSLQRLYVGTGRGLWRCTLPSPAPAS